MMRVPFHRRALVAGAAIAALAATAPAAWAHLPQTPVKTQRPDPRVRTAVSADYFAWQQTTRRHPHTYNVLAQAMVAGTPGGPVTRVNAPSTVAFTGGIAGTRLVYQQVVNGRQSDIHYFNLLSHRHSNPPLGVNSTRWEYDPRITSGWLLFGRDAHQASHIILWNLSTNTHTVLLTVPFNRHGTAFADTGQVNGDYATFWACTNRTHCSVYLYTISTATKVHITPPTGLEEYDSAVSSTGTLYFARGGSSCGVGIQLHAAAAGRERHQPERVPLRDRPGGDANVQRRDERPGAVQPSGLRHQWHRHLSDDGSLIRATSCPRRSGARPAAQSMARR